MLPRQDPSTAGHLFAPHEEGMSPTAVPPHGDPGREGKLNLHVGTSSISAFCHRFLCLSRNFTSSSCVGCTLSFLHRITRFVTTTFTHPWQGVVGANMGRGGPSGGFSIKIALPLPLCISSAWEEGTGDAMGAPTLAVAIATCWEGRPRNRHSLPGKCRAGVWGRIGGRDKPSRTENARGCWEGWGSAVRWSPTPGIKHQEKQGESFSGKSHLSLQLGLVCVSPRP